MLALKSILKTSKITNNMISNELGIKSLSTVSQKINHKSDFTVNEAIKLRDLIQRKTSKKYSIEELFEEDE